MYFDILTLISYSIYNGIVTNIRVIKSGGVIIAATAIIVKNACFLYFANMLYDTNPIFVKTDIITGS